MVFPWLAVAVGISAVSTLAGGAGAYKESQATQRSMRAKANLSLRNAEAGKEAAEDAIARGEKEVETHSRKIRATQSTDKSYRAATGFLIDDADPESTARQATEDIAVAGASDIMTLRENARREEKAHRQRAAAATEQAELFFAEAEAESPLLAGATTLLQGASRTAMLAA